MGPLFSSNTACAAPAGTLAMSAAGRHVILTLGVVFIDGGGKRTLVVCSRLREARAAACSSYAATSDFEESLGPSAVEPWSRGAVNNVYPGNHRIGERHPQERK